MIDLTINEHPQETLTCLGMTELTQKFGKENIAHILHAFIVEKSIVFITRSFIDFDIEFISNNFNLFLPEKLRKPDFVIGIESDQVSEGTKKYAIVFDPAKKKIDVPWSKKILKPELGLIAFASEILDPKIQIELLKEMFRLLYEKAKFAKLVIENTFGNLVLSDKVLFAGKYIVTIGGSAPL